MNEPTSFKEKIRKKKQEKKISNKGCNIEGLREKKEYRFYTSSKEEQ